MQVELDGGRWDGALLERASPPPAIAWVDERLRFCRSPGPGRVLYYRTTAGHYTAYNVVQCPHCGWFIPRRPCPVCGEGVRPSLSDADG